jgi:DNA-binding CsgD family transcriptional regulator
VLLGRADDLAELRRALTEDRAVVVSGEAGIGKTTLLRAAATDSGRAVFEGGGLATLSWMAYLPLRRALGLDVVGDPTAVADEVEAAVGAGVLLVDDVHWADAGTLEVLTMLAGRVGVLTGVRRGDPGADTTLDRLRDAGYTEHTVDPLDESTAGDVVRSLRPDLGAPDVRRLITRTGGNPLLLRELSATGEPSASLRLALAARLRQLDDAARETFELIALAGRPLRAAALDESGVKSLLAVDLAVTDGTEIAIRHALLAEVAVAGMAADRRRELHARLARAVSEPGEAARHYERAGEPDRAHSAALRAAEATALPAERASHLALAAATATGPAADELRLRAALALEQAHDWEAMIGVLAGLDRTVPRMQAWAHLLRARGSWTAGDAEGLRANLDAGLALVAGTGSEIEVRLLIERTRVPMFLDNDLAAAVESSGSALALAQSTAVDVPRALYLHGTALSIADEPGGAEYLADAVQAARDSGDTTTEFLAAYNLVSHHESAGDPAVGRELCERFIVRAHELGLREWEYGFREALAELDFHAGHYDKVIAEGEELLGIVREPRGHDQLLEAYCLALIDVGRIDEALRRLEDMRITSDYKGILQLTWVRTEAALWGGEPARALELAEQVLAGPDADPNTLFGHTSRAWALFDLGREPGPPPPLHTRYMLQAVSIEVDALGLLYRGDHAAAADRFTAAADVWHGWHLRGELRCRWGAAEAARRAGDAAAVRMLEDVEADVQAHGMLPLLGRVHRSLRAAGQRRSAPRTRSAGSTLTGRQREVLALVGEGLTNAQIAHRLGISRHTVVAQLASASAKLGAANRAQAAVLAGAG